MQAIDILGIGLVLPEGVATPGRALGMGAVPAYRIAGRPWQGLVQAARLRRLGRTQRLALAAAHLALDGLPQGQAAQQETAVLVGTGLGSLDETTLFVENMFELEEAQPRPTRFINSVHNAIASQIAIEFGFQGANHTFTHNVHSFESAIWQALRLLGTGRAELCLVAGVDGLSPYSLSAGRAFGWWREEDGPLAPMTMGAQKSGTIPGEGVAAFALANRASGHRRAVRLVAFEAGPVDSPGFDPDREARFIEETLAAAGIALESIDLFLLGADGDAGRDLRYEAVLEALGTRGRPVVSATYKGACGEFCTASAVGLALAAMAARDAELPDAVACHPDAPHSSALSTLACYQLSPRFHSVCVVTR